MTRVNALVSRLWANARVLDSRRPWLVDCALAGMLFLGAVLATASPGPEDRPPDVTSYVLIAVGALPYVVRRSAPLLVLVVASVPVLALGTLGYGSAVIGSGLFLAAYTVAAWSSARQTAIAVGYVSVLLVAVAVLVPRTMQIGELAVNAALFLGAFAVGRGAHTRRRNVALLAIRAELAEHVRVEEAARAVADERLRIAQELHDVLAHSLGVIALQAGVGAHVIDTDPAEAKASLLAVAQTSRSALAEVRRILSALRTDDDPGGYHPPQGLDGLADLAAELRAAGLAVDVHVEGERASVPAALDLTAYRLIQEALTNVVKHAGDARAEVTVRYSPGAVELEVVDDGRALEPVGAASARRPVERMGGRAAAHPGAQAAGPGHGQVGMRERVAVWGGSLTAGPRPGGGYRVAARLPYPQEMS